MKELLDFAAMHNFPVYSVELDGKLRRFDRNGKKNAWYIGWQNHMIKTGEAYQVCVFGDWKTGEEITYKPDKKYSKEDNEAIRKAMKDAMERSKAETAIKQKEAMSDANQTWLKATIHGIQHDYLTKKQISKPYGTRLYGDALLVPMVDISNQLWGIQRIFPDGKKRFLTGQRVNGLFHALGDIHGNEFFLCEGFATGVSIYEAVHKCVICTFSAHNLVEVAKELRREYPHASITICGDDDRFTDGQNAGREKAEKAAAICQGSLIFPQFPEGSKGTDFNDVHLESGLEELKAQLGSVEHLEDPPGFVPLGFDDGTYYFYTFESKNVIKIGGFAEHQMLQLMPLSYWEDLYMGKKGISWTTAKNNLIRLSQKVGPYNPTRVRGTGVWSDAGRIVINTGDCLVINRAEVSHCAIRSKYIYVKTNNKMPKISDQPLNVDQSSKLIRACQTPHWKLKKSGSLLAGWIAIARVAGALPIRPHIWITGGAGTGKSTVMGGLINPALGDPSARLYLQGGSTEAGIRQSVKADSLPLLFDEFESVGVHSRERIASIIDLLRQSWSYTEGCIVKGSAGGTASQYSLAFAALVSSIRVGLETDADRSRFSVLELGKHGSDQEHFKDFIKQLSDINEEYGERLFARSVNQLPNILKSYDVFRQSLATIISQRFGQQYGMLLAGFYSLCSDSPVTYEIAEELCKQIDWEEEKGNEKSKDEVEALNYLTENMIRLVISSADSYSYNEEGEVCKRSLTNQ